MEPYLYGVAVGPVLTRPVRLDNSLRQSCRARTVDDIELIRHVIANHRCTGTGMFNELIEGLPARTIKPHRDKIILQNISKITAYLFQSFPHAFRCDDQLCIAVVDQPFDLLCCQKTAQRDDAGPGLDDAIHHFKRFNGITHQNGNLVTAAQAIVPDGVCNAVQVVIEIPPAAPNLPTDNGFLVRGETGVGRP